MPILVADATCSDITLFLGVDSSQSKHYQLPKTYRAHFPGTASSLTQDWRDRHAEDSVIALDNPGYRLSTVLPGTVVLRI